MYDCSRCAEQPHLYLALGHDAAPIGPMWRENLVTGTPLPRCPRRELLEADQDALAEIDVARFELFPLYKKGRLYAAGGVADQPSRYLAMMREFEIAESLAEAKYLALVKESGSGENRHSA